jgi:RNA polymerase sigma-70 factor, ECF subfamily
MADLTDRLYERLLVLRCQTGEAAAFSEIIERYGPRLRYYLGQMVERCDEVDDVLQEVWLAVFRKVATLAEPAAFRAWLYRIAHDKASLSLRRRPREIRLEASNFFDGEERDEFSAEDAEQIHAALAKLDGLHREVLILRFVEEMNYEQLARVTDCPVGTIRSRLHYAKCALRREIERMNSDGREETG